MIFVACHKCGSRRISFLGYLNQCPSCADRTQPPKVQKTLKAYCWPITFDALDGTTIISQSLPPSVSLSGLEVRVTGNRGHLQLFLRCEPESAPDGAVRLEP